MQKFSESSDLDIKIILCITIVIVLCCAGPHLVIREEGANYLAVKGEPFVVISVEDHKTYDYKGRIREELFRTAKDLHANTISVTLCWYLFEKKKNAYDTTILRNIKNSAEKYGLKVIILWFGSNISGHENCVPNYIRGDTITYVPHTRSDNTFATRINDDGSGRILCYSHSKQHENHVLIQEMKALETLITWIVNNDSNETYIMIQIENELFIHAELWRPWPPVHLTSTILTTNQNSYVWEKPFDVQACSIKIETSIEMPKNCQLEIAIIDTNGSNIWNALVNTNGKQKFRIGGAFINQKCRLTVQKKSSCVETIRISALRIRPIPERCHCKRCERIFSTQKFLSDIDYQHSVFMNYIKKLSMSIAKVDNDFPLYLNLFIRSDAKKLLGNPYYRPGDYLSMIPEIDLLSPDIYYESSISVIDSLDFGRNAIFVPETGKFKEQNSQDCISAHSLIFLIIGKHQGIGVQLYNLKGLRFGLLAPDGAWEEDAYLTRNSFNAIRQLSPRLISESAEDNIFGFRNVTKEITRLGDYYISIKSIAIPEYTRGLILITGNALVICGIAFEVTVHTKEIDPEKVQIERCCWIQNTYVSLGDPKPNTYKIGKNTIKVTMDEDNLSPPDTFDPINNQYCVKITLE